MYYILIIIGTLIIVGLCVVSIVRMPSVKVSAVDDFEGSFEEEDTAPEVSTKKKRDSRGRFMAK